MRPLGANEFLTWVAEAGIGRDERYPNSLELAFLSGEVSSLYWIVPPDHDQAAKLFRLVLDAIGGTGDVIVWPRDGSWWAQREKLEQLDPSSPLGEIIGSPEDPAAVVGPGERSELVKFLAHAAEEGGRLSDDIHLIPADRSCILLLSHHQTLHASAHDLDHQKRIVEQLERGGFTQHVE